jgi:hypothetical protein
LQWELGYNPSAPTEVLVAMKRFLRELYLAGIGKLTDVPAVVIAAELVKDL